MSDRRGGRRVVLGTLTACLVLALAGDGPAAKKKQVDLGDWIAGPIRYVTTPHEAKTFKKLKKDSDRALYIDKFWARRDPTPETFANEYRQTFWERVNESNARFLDSSKPGWKTDRGKIHILYGPPTRIEEDLHVQTEASASAGHGMIRWLYEGRPGQRMDLNPVVVVAFVRDTGGEYRVTYDPELTSIFYDPRPMENKHEANVDRFLEAFGAPIRSELSVMLDLGRMQEVPPQAQVFLERVETVESYQTHPIDTLVGRYVRPDDGHVVVVVTVDVSHVPEGSVPSVLARFTFAGDPTRQPRMLGEDTFKVATTGGRRLAQARMALAPGRYDLTVLVVDPNTAATGMHRSSVVVLPSSPGMRLSDVQWAAEIQPLEYASLASHDEAFHVGPFRVLPRFGLDYRPGDTLKLFYEVYGGRPPYRVAYQVEGREDDGRWVALGRPSSGEQSGAAQGWELQTTSLWPLGEYQVQIAITDQDSRQVEVRVPFHLQQAEEAAPAE